MSIIQLDPTFMDKVLSFLNQPVGDSRITVGLLIAVFIILYIISQEWR
jgi:hypothetical protein